jgi:hypothetical protein
MAPPSGRSWISVGRLDTALDAAAIDGWTVVSMKDDWKRIFAFEGVR